MKSNKIHLIIQGNKLAFWINWVINTYNLRYNIEFDEAGLRDFGQNIAIFCTSVNTDVNIWSVNVSQKWRKKHALMTMITKERVTSRDRVTWSYPVRN